MIAVIFEVISKPEKLDEYLSVAKDLQLELAEVPGFKSIERFKSVSNEDKILSLSFWEDEDSVKKWRNSIIHREAQKKGRDSIFEDYRLRVVHVIRDYTLKCREEAPEDNIF